MLWDMVATREVAHTFPIIKEVVMTKYKLLTTVMGVALAGAVSAAELGQGSPNSSMDSSAAPSSSQSFEQLDKNKDGVISRDEAKADPTINKHFKQLDTDKDGK